MTPDDAHESWWEDLPDGERAISRRWSAQLRPVGPDLAFPEWVRVVHNLGDLYVLVVVTPQGDRVGAAEVRARQHSGGSPVTVEEVRNLPIARLVRGAGWEHLHARHEEPGSDYIRIARHAVMQSEKFRKELVQEGPTDRTLRAIAHLYRVAYAVGDGPVRFIEESMELSRSKTSRWIALARERGFLGPAEGPGRAGG